MSRRSPRLQGALNLRDLGGHRTHDGRRTLWGRVYRGSELRELPPRSVRALINRGICRLVDLRTHGQAAAQPHPLRDGRGVEYVTAALLADGDAIRIEDWPGYEALYTSWLRERPEQIAAAVTAIALSPGPVLVNCSAGVDRTGVVVALVLSAVGVPHATVAREFALSERAYRADLPMWVQSAVAAGWTQKDAEAALPIRAEPMLGVLKELAAEWGGAESYLVAAGVSKQAMTAMNELLLGG